MITHTYRLGKHTMAKVELSGGGSINCKMSEAWEYVMHSPLVEPNTAAYCDRCAHKSDGVCLAMGVSCGFSLSERCFGRNFKEVNHVS
jgi:ribosomal protein L37E